MNDEPYMQVIVDAALFFGLGSDEQVDPDSAVSQLEQIASRLRRLGDDERKRFISFVEDLARREEQEMGRNERVEFLFSLAENLGL